MTGVINVGVQLPDVIFPVVIRPSGGLTPLISLSFSVSTHLQFMCFTAHVSLFLYILLLRISAVFSPDFLSPFSLYLHLPYWLFKIISSLSSSCCTRLPLALWPLHSQDYNGIQLIYVAILVLQYVNLRELEPHYWRGQYHFKSKLHKCCNYGVIGKFTRTHKAIPF